MASDDDLYGGVLINSLVLDIGSSKILLGPGGDIVPCTKISPFYSTPKPTTKKAKIVNSNKTNVNTDSIFFVSTDEVSSTTKNSQIVNLDIFDSQLEDALKTIFLIKDDQIADLSKTPVLISEPADTKSAYKKGLARYFFEQKDVSGLYFKRSASLNAFSVGKTTALVVDSGHEQTSVSPVFDGFQIFSGTYSTSIAGHCFNKEIINKVEAANKDLIDENFIYSKAVETRNNKHKKELPTLSYLNYEKEKFANDLKINVSNQYKDIEWAENEDVSEYTLNDNVTTIKVTNNEIRKICFSLFGEIVGPDSKTFEGIQNMVINSVNDSDIEVRKELFGNIVVCGGSFKINGYKDRLEEELEGLGNNMSSVIKIKVSKNEHIDELENSCWIGGSILSSLGTFQSMWVAKKEYEEYGENVLDKKCY
eukprot:GAHX01001014.1.p1 GENE.GAHX01001014.1~~GAHX01001014.1.p1  ORF type:complete len:434 (+),score=101.44 GAHX01001014.1:38-1303(+)